MASPDWGTKRTGPCGTKFYDFNKRPIICPNCGGKVNINEVQKKDLKIESNVSEQSNQKNDIENSEDDISLLLDDDIDIIDEQKNSDLQDVIDEKDDLNIIEDKVVNEDNEDINDDDKVI